jgi:hypothetical protein
MLRKERIKDVVAEIAFLTEVQNLEKITVRSPNVLATIPS